MPHTESLLAGHYFLAVHGLALLRALFVDSTAATAHADAIRTIVGELDEFPHSLSIPITELDVVEGYTQWAPRYDGFNPAIAGEEPIVHEMLSALPTGLALDAACGTGRHAAKLAQLGHEVIGVDATDAMLEIARAKVPSADFRLGRLEALPVDDASDLVGCRRCATSHASGRCTRSASTHAAASPWPTSCPALLEIHGTPRVLSRGSTAVDPDGHLIRPLVGEVACCSPSSTSARSRARSSAVHPTGHCSRDDVLQLVVKRPPAS